MLQETLGGQFGEICTMMQYFFPSSNFRMGYHNAQFNFRLDNTRIAEIFSGTTPSRNGGELTITDPPAGFAVPELPDMPNEHSPGLADMSS